MKIRRIKKLASSQRWNVWLCKTEDGELVIEKIPAYTITPREIKYYAKRAKIWKEKLNKNPNIAKLVWFDETNARFIIRYYPKTLRQILERRGRIPVGAAKGIIKGIINALRDAHEIGVVHGDIKPENVMLDETNAPKLSDWEDAILIMEEDNIIQYTPSYEAPEQRKGDPTMIDERTDIYQLGILLYEMIEGKKPETLTFMRTPQYLRKIIVKCLKESPDERYQTIDEIMADLRIETSTMERPIEITERPEYRGLPPIERVRKFLEEIEEKPVAISIEKIADKLNLTAQQVRAAINIVTKEKGVAMLEGRIITIPAIIQLAVKTRKPLAEILARQKLPTEWWQRLLMGIEKQNIVVPFGKPVFTGAAEKIKKIKAKVVICADYAVPERIIEQIENYVVGKTITKQLIADIATAFSIPQSVAQAIIQRKTQKIFEYEHGGLVLSVCFSPDGEYLATGSVDRYIRVFRVGDWTKIFEYKHGSPVYSICFSPDGKFLATGSKDKYVRVFRVGFVFCRDFI